MFQLVHSLKNKIKPPMNYLKSFNVVTIGMVDGIPQALVDARVTEREDLGGPVKVIRLTVKPDAAVFNPLWNAISAEVEAAVNAAEGQGNE